ncbi:MAG: hypothetical protein K8R10_12105 [Rhodocyclales bacterium]|nr:hypothetical protein [Rhodocyclales bacterium]
MATAHRTLNNNEAAKKPMAEKCRTIANNGGFCVLKSCEINEVVDCGWKMAIETAAEKNPSAPKMS